MGLSDNFYRLKRLPPYVFAQVQSLKLEARHRGEDIIDFGKNRMKMTVTLTGTLKLSIPYVPSSKESFRIDLFAFEANVPTTPELNDLLHLTKQPTPRSWGESQTRGWGPPPPANPPPTNCGTHFSRRLGDDAAVVQQDHVGAFAPGDRADLDRQAARHSAATASGSSAPS